MKQGLALLIAAFVVVLSGCLGGGKNESPQETTMQKEAAELVKLYRQCLQKYEEYPEKAKERCSVYKDAIHEIAPEHHKSFVSELLDRLRDKSR